MAKVNQNVDNYLAGAVRNLDCQIIDGIEHKIYENTGQGILIAFDPAREFRHDNYVKKNPVVGHEYSGHEEFDARLTHTETAILHYVVEAGTEVTLEDITTALYMDDQTSEDEAEQILRNKQGSVRGMIQQINNLLGFEGHKKYGIRQIGPVYFASDKYKWVPSEN